MIKNGIHHVRTAPYHPASNGRESYADPKGRTQEILQWVFGDQTFPFPISITNYPSYHGYIASSTPNGQMFTLTPRSTSSRYGSLGGTQTRITKAKV